MIGTNYIEVSDTTITTPRLALLGDISGHQKPFFGRLAELGIRTSTSQIPDDLVILQVGDLIGHAPDASAKLIQTVRALRHHNPGQWVQLMGNWEARHHRDGVPFKTAKGEQRDLDPTFVSMLNQFWREPHTGIAATISSETMPPVLVSHAGVTRYFLACVSAFDEPDATKVAYDIAAAYGDPERRRFIFQAGEMLAGSQDDPAPGPLWASHRELWRSWTRRPLRFDQIVGHTSPYMYNKDRWYDPQPIDETRWAQVNPAKRMTYWQPPQSEFGIGHIDPAIWRGSPAAHLPAHIFHNVTVTIPRLGQLAPHT